MRLIIDTDTAGDDCFSILMAARHPDVSLEAVTICNGNVDFDSQVSNALKTLEIAELTDRVPVYAGCRRPLMRQPVDAEYVFGLDGMSDANLAPAAQVCEQTHAVDALIKMIMANPGEITLIAQAPLTNIATAVTREPLIASALKHLWIMGGTDNAIGNVTPAAEFNFYVDPEAAKIVFSAGFAISLVTWTLAASSSAIDEELHAIIAASGSPRAKFFGQVNQAAVQFSSDHYGHNHTLHPDTLTCACAIAPELITSFENAVVEIETQSVLTRGYSSVSSSLLPLQEIADPALGPSRNDNAKIIKAVDTALFRRMLVESLS